MSKRPYIKTDAAGTLVDLPLDADTVKGVNISDGNYDKPSIANTTYKTSIWRTHPGTWNSDYDPAPTYEYGHYIRFVNGNSSGNPIDMTDIYVRDGGSEVYVKSGWNAQNNTDSATWGTWNRIAMYADIPSSLPTSDVFTLRASSGTVGKLYLQKNGTDISNCTINVPSGSMLWNNGSTTWVANNNIVCSADSGEFSFDVTDNTGNETVYWHVWSGNLNNSMLQCYPSSGRVNIPYTLTVAGNTVATQSWVQNQGYLTSHQDISGKLNKSGDTMTGTLNMNGNRIQLGTYTTTLLESRGTLESDAARTLPTYGGQPIVMQTAAGRTGDIGALWLSEDNAFICNSSDNGYTFCVFDTDLTTDFSDSIKSSFGVRSNGEGLDFRGTMRKVDGSSTAYTYTFPNKSGTVAMTSDIPTVNNPTITFTQGGTTKGSITLNQSSNKTIALDGGGGTLYTHNIHLRISITGNEECFGKKIYISSASNGYFSELRSDVLVDFTFISSSATAVNSYNNFPQNFMASGRITFKDSATNDMLGTVNVYGDEYAESTRSYIWLDGTIHPRSNENGTYYYISCDLDNLSSYVTITDTVVPV